MIFLYKNISRFFIPFFVFCIFSAVFLTHLFWESDQAGKISSGVGRMAPNTILPAIPGLETPRFDLQVFPEKILLVNFFASWCLSCQSEHSLLMDLAQDKRFILVGINYKDEEKSILNFLKEKGNPYAAIGMDTKGFSAFEWGIHGIPETFLIGKDKRILFRHAGPLTSEIIQSNILPIIIKEY